MGAIERTKAAFAAIEEVVRRGRYTRTAERRIEPLVFGVLQARWGALRREVRAEDPGRDRPRIDFRFGSTNPIVIELAVRPRAGGQQLEASQNGPELRKLSHVPQSQARLRSLVLLDLGEAPLSIGRLREDYTAKVRTTDGMGRNPIQVIYVHRHEQRSFGINRRSSAV